MTELQITRHAVERLAQRNIAEAEIDLILAIATEVPDGFVVRRKDCQAVEKAVKAFLDRLRRLEGKRLVVRDGQIVTAFHATRTQQHRLLCKGRDHGEHV